MNKNKETLVKTLGVITAISGMAVIAGWIYDIPALKSVSPSWISMKISTAICFLLSGIALYFTADAKNKGFDIKQIILSAVSLSILLIMATLLISNIIGLQTGIEELFIKEREGAANTFAPGRPSVPTMFNFVLTAVSFIFILLDIKKLTFALKITGFLIFIVGAVAVAGYIFNAPVLYYKIENINNPMALHTAVLFMFLGAGIFLRGEQACQ